MNKVEHVTAIEAVSVINQDLLVRTAHGSAPGGCQFIRSVEFGAPHIDARQLCVGRKVRITIELLPEDESAP